MQAPLQRLEQLGLLMYVGPQHSMAPMLPEISKKKLSIVSAFVTLHKSILADVIKKVVS